jgi:hypothetical protein
MPLSQSKLEHSKPFERNYYLVISAPPFLGVSASPLLPNNGLTGAFSSINPYREKLFLLIPSGRVLSGSFSVIITSV